MGIYAAMIFLLLASHFVLERSWRGERPANGKPIGIIGDPLSSGLTTMAFYSKRHSQSCRTGHVTG